jgi:hypothetical protein
VFYQRAFYVLSLGLHVPANWRSALLRSSSLPAFRLRVDTSRLSGLVHRIKTTCFAVGTGVTSRPPPRSVRAAFPHTAPPWVNDGKCLPMRSSACATLIRFCDRLLLCWPTFPLVPRPLLHRLRRSCPCRYLRSGLVRFVRRLHSYCGVVLGCAVQKVAIANSTVDTFVSMDDELILALVEAGLGGWERYQVRIGVARNFSSRVAISSGTTQNRWVALVLSRGPAQPRRRMH